MFWHHILYLLCVYGYPLIYYCSYKWSYYFCFFNLFTSVISLPVRFFFFFFAFTSETFFFPLHFIFSFGHLVSAYRSFLKNSFKGCLVVISSFSFSLSEKLFILPSILSNNLLDRLFLALVFFLFITLNILFHSHVAWKFLLINQLIIL